MITIGVVAVFFLTACAGGNEPVAPLPAEADSHQVAAFAAKLLPSGSTADTGEAQCSVEVTHNGSDVIASIAVSGAVGATALICDLAYDPAAFTPREIITADLLGPAGELLELTHMDDPGTVHLAQVLVHPQDQPGFTGDGSLATVRFARSPFIASRTASAAPVNDAAQLQLADTWRGALTWYHTNQGDYDQNGLVSVADLVPIAIYYEESVAPGQFPIQDARSQVDGDSNGMINISDITFIGVNFGHSVLGGFRVYVSSSADDYPAANDAPNGAGAELLGTLQLKEIDPSEPINQRRFYSFPVQQPQEHLYYWVRPADETGAEGTPSALWTELGLRVPRSDLARSPARLDSGNNTLTWYYCNPGDTDLDGEVNDTDLALVSGHIDEIGPYHPNSIMGLIDVNQDNVINTADEDLLLVCHGRMIWAYNVYLSDDPADYPAGNAAPSTITPTGKIHRSKWLVDGGEHGQRPYLLWPTSNANRYHWVRPVDYLGNEGTPSILQGPAGPEYGAPVNAYSIPAAGYDHSTATLTWYYYNTGDYNQNGVHEMSDLAPIGQNFGLKGPFDPASSLSILDGNHDDLISELDMSVVGKYWSSDCRGYNIYLSATAAGYAFGSTNPSTIEPLGSVELSDALGDVSTDRLYFEYEIPADAPGAYLWVRPYGRYAVEGIASRLLLRTD